MSEREVRWGVIGCGGIADRRTIPEGIIPAENSRLVALMGPHIEKVRSIGEKYGVERCYSREEDLLKDPEVDAVYIASPNSAHRSQVIAAAEHGKHILCEKPLGMTVDECNEMIAACRKNGVKLAVGFMMRFHSCHTKAKQLVDQGMIGKLVLGRAQLTTWYPEIDGAWRQDPERGGGGCLIDMGIHCIHLLRMFLGEVKEVSAIIGNAAFSYPVEDSALVAMAFEGDGYGISDSFFSIPDHATLNRFELYGTEGSILMDRTIGQESTGSLILRTETQRGYEARQARAPFGGIEISPPSVNMYRAEVEDLAAAVLEDREPLNTGEEALKVQRVVEAAYESARRGISVRLG